jgi:hypothetical protein
MKALLHGALGALLLAAPVAAAPITGDLGITGVFRGEDAAGNVTRLATAVGLDFCANLTGACITSNGGTGIFMVDQVGAGNMPVSAGDTGIIKDIAPLGATIGPITTFLSINGLTFDLLSATVTRMTVPAPHPRGSAVDYIGISGQGILRLAGYDDTPGTFTFTGQSDGVRLASVFTFSGGAGALPVPVPTPAGLALLGMGLAAVMFLRRRS